MTLSNVNTWKAQIDMSKIPIVNIRNIFLYYHSEIFSHYRAQLAKLFHLEEQKLNKKWWATVQLIFNCIVSFKMQYNTMN